MEKQAFYVIPLAFARFRNIESGWGFEFEAPFPNEDFPDSQKVREACDGALEPRRPEMELWRPMRPEMEACKPGRLEMEP